MEQDQCVILLVSPVQLVLLISSAGRFVLRVTVSSVRSRAVKTVFSKFFSSCSDLEEAKQIGPSKMCASLLNLKSWCFLNGQAKKDDGRVPHLLLWNWGCVLASLRKSSCCTSNGVSLKEEAGLSYKVVALQMTTNSNRHFTSPFQSFCCLIHKVVARFVQTLIW